ncbi:hypothetical protein HNO52_11285 [Billgrantia diversa]|uniref:hypothetical protein n=1 Tax=Halomonas sp. MCCC 1A13316 TaxID=2733487 RepID=UPI0018A4AAA2|nr:hypothetical protein [Halomonas sp. MCCC 1A13316]QOR39037.1 hypothetical protein HNO52_11285 [Halomonas sp. MCCC 1A13316]
MTPAFNEVIAQISVNYKAIFEAFCAVNASGARQAIEHSAQSWETNLSNRD